MSIAPKVYKAINAIQAELCREGITKARVNTAQSYKFRGIDDVYNALSPLMAQHGLCILPRMIKRDCQERVTAKNTPIFYVTVEAEFDFVSTEDGSAHVVRTFGEAMDSADKATNKAMSAAYKYAAFQAFAIPTEGDNDADAHTIPVATKQTHASAEPEYASQRATNSIIYDEALSKIRSANDLVSLEKAFREPYEYAKSFGDVERGKQIIDATKARKAELEAQVPL